MQYKSDFFISQTDFNLIKKFETDKLVKILEKINDKKYNEQIKRYFL